MSNETDTEAGAFVTQSVTQDIPISVGRFWSAFDEYLPLQAVLGGHRDVKLVTGAGRPNNGVGAEIEFDFEGSATREVLWQKDDTNHVWVMGISAPNAVFSYYRATVGVWQGSTGARAKLSIDGVLAAKDAGGRAAALALMAQFIPTRLPEISRFVLNRDGLRSHFELDLDFDLERYWSIISDWGNVSWVMGATAVDPLGDDVRRVWFGPAHSLTERLVSTDPATHTLHYSMLTSELPVDMYEGTVTLTKSATGGTHLVYSSVYLVKDGVDGAAAKAAIDKSFEQRVVWMKATFSNAK